MISNAPLEAPASEILPFLTMSNERDANNPEFIKSNGITHVLNLTPSPFHADVTAIATCRCIPLTDTTSQDIIEKLPEAIAFIGMSLIVKNVTLISPQRRRGSVAAKSLCTALRVSRGRQPSRLPTSSKRSA
jgi:hypothetical protein